jgi:hypothetical protein
MGLGEMGLGEMVLGEMVLGDMGIHHHVTTALIIPYVCTICIILLGNGPL